MTQAEPTPEELIATQQGIEELDQGNFITLDALEIVTEKRDLMQWLAALEVKCPDCVLIQDKEGWGSGCRCKGSGSVPRYPTLRREPWTRGYANKQNQTFHSYNDGSDLGWVVPPVAEWRSLVEGIAEGRNLEVHHLLRPKRTLLTLTDIVPPLESKQWCGKGPDTTLNLLQAMMKALEAEGE